MDNMHEVEDIELRECDCVNCKLERIQRRLTKLTKMVGGLIERHKGYLGLDGDKRRMGGR